MERTLVLILTHKETLKNFYKKKLLTNYFKSVIINISKERKEKIMENIMESLGLMVGKETVLFDVTTGEIISKERTEVLAYLKRNDGFYTLQVF